MCRTASAAFVTSMCGLRLAPLGPGAVVQRLHHVGRGIADVDLPAGDVERPAVEAEGLRQAGDRVLGRRVADRPRARRIGRDRAVVDDASALRRLPPHLREGDARGVEHAGQVHRDRTVPVVGVDLVDGAGGREDARVVEQDVEPPPPVDQLADGGLDLGPPRDVAGQDQRLAGRGDTVQRIGTAGEEPDPPAGGQRPLGHRSPDARAGARDQHGLRHVSSSLSSSGTSGAFRSAVPSGPAGFLSLFIDAPSAVRVRRG